jgi:CRISPR/Cas system CMR subunit Cmr6 (Cas7 group RAMP superfamily)
LWLVEHITIWKQLCSNNNKRKNNKIFYIRKPNLQILTKNSKKLIHSLLKNFIQMIFEELKTRSFTIIKQGVYLAISQIFTHRNLNLRIINFSSSGLNGRIRNYCKLRLLRELMKWFIKMVGLRRFWKSSPF